MAQTTSSVTAAAMFADAFGPTGFNEGFSRISDAFHGLSAFQKETLDAWTAAAAILADGAERAATDHASFANAAYENAVAAVRAAASARSVQEVFDIQSDFAKSAIERNVRQFQNITDLWLGAVTDAMAPLANRYSEMLDHAQAYRP